MEDGLKTIFSEVRFNDMIVECDRRSYHPYATNAYDNSDEINLVIQKADLITATYNSVVYIEGTLTPTDATKAYNLTNNAPLFLFDEVRFVLGDQTIEVVRMPGINSSMKGYVSYSTEQTNCLKQAGWSPFSEELQIVDGTKKSFCASIPLRHFLGFAEGYRKPIINMRQELILVRAKSDLDCYKGETNVKIAITKMLWKVPYVIPNDATKLNLYEKINKNAIIPVSFHARDLFIYPTLPASRSLVWPVKSSTGFQRPQWILVAFQTAKRNSKQAVASDFNHVSATSVKASINNRRYPYEQQNFDFANNKYTDVYDEYLNFRTQYYDDNIAGSLFDYKQFKDKPIFIVNCTKQNESVYNAVVDLKLEVEAVNSFDPNTVAYCLILHDVLFEYEPFTGLVRKT